MSSLIEVENLCKTFNLNICVDDIIDIIYIPEDFISLELSEENGIIFIDKTKKATSIGESYSKIFIFRIKNKRFLIIAIKNQLFTSAQLYHKIKYRQKHQSPKEVLDQCGINPKYYILTKIINRYTFKEEYYVKFIIPKLMSSNQKLIKIECFNYIIISEN